MGGNVLKTVNSEQCVKCDALTGICFIQRECRKTESDNKVINA